MAYTGIQAPFLNEGWVGRAWLNPATQVTLQAANEVTLVYINRAYNPVLGIFHYWPSDDAPDPTMAYTHGPGVESDYTTHEIVEIITT